MRNWCEIAVKSMRPRREIRCEIDVKSLWKWMWDSCEIVMKSDVKLMRNWSEIVVKLVVKVMWNRCEIDLQSWIEIPPNLLITRRVVLSVGKYMISMGIPAPGGAAGSQTHPEAGVRPPCRPPPHNSCWEPEGGKDYTLYITPTCC